jgi:hypothetical protein
VTTTHRVLITCIAGALCAISAYSGNGGPGWFVLAVVIVWWGYL